MAETNWKGHYKSIRKILNLNNLYAHLNLFSSFEFQNLFNFFFQRGLMPCSSWMSYKHPWLPFVPCNTDDWVKHMCKRYLHLPLSILNNNFGWIIFGEVISIREKPSRFFWLQIWVRFLWTFKCWTLLEWEFLLGPFNENIPIVKFFYIATCRLTKVIIYLKIIVNK